MRASVVALKSGPPVCVFAASYFPGLSAYKRCRGIVSATQLRNRAWAAAQNTARALRRSPSAVAMDARVQGLPLTPGDAFWPTRVAVASRRELLVAGPARGLRLQRGEPGSHYAGTGNLAPTRGSKAMRTPIGLIAALLAASPATAQAPLGATDITAAEVQAFVKALPRDLNADRPIRAVDVGGYRMAVFAVFRPKEVPVTSTVHQTKVTEVYYMLEGAGVLVTGGAQGLPATTQPSRMGNWIDSIGRGIEGGVARRIGKGDVVIIPGGVPHSWSSVEGDLTYLIIRADPDNLIPLK